MNRFATLFLAALGLAGLGALPAQAALLGRLPVTPEGTDYQAYYDTVLDITWLADANYAQTSGYSVTGQLTWDGAQAFMATLNTGAHLGITGWRLPTLTIRDPNDCQNFAQRLNPAGTDCGYNTNLNFDPTQQIPELSSLFYDTLGNVAFFFPDGSSPQPNNGLTQTGPFTNMLNRLYWYGVEYANDPNLAWYFGMPSGGQGPRGKQNLEPAWAVVDGDPLNVIPIPAAVWLFASGLGLLAGLRRRNLT